MRKRGNIGHVRKVRSGPSDSDHLVHWLDADDVLGVPGPETRGQPRPASEVDHELRLINAGELRQQIKQHRRWPWPIQLVPTSEPRLAVPTASDLIGNSVEIRVGHSASLST